MKVMAWLTISIIGSIFLFLGLPELLSPQNLYLLDLSGIYSILAMSLALTVGFGGLLSLAHPVFFGIGAYFTGLAMIAGFPFFPSLLLSGFFSGLIALVIGVPSLRTRGVYFAITTLCVTIIFEMVLNNWVSLTQGDSGLGGIPKPGLLAGTGLMHLKMKTGTFFHYLISLIAIFTALTLYRITHSEIGRTMIAIRDQKELASLTGINTLKYEVINFCIGAFFAGVAGSLYAIYMRYLHPSDFGILQCFDILAMVVVGGANSISGPIVGSLFINFFPELIGIDPALKRIAYGIVIILVVIFMPQGLQGLLNEGLIKPIAEKLGMLRRDKQGRGLSR